VATAPALTNDSTFCEEIAVSIQRCCACQVSGQMPDCSLYVMPLTLRIRLESLKSGTV